MMQFTEVKKEDDLYFQGDFWIKGTSVRDVIRGNFNLLYEKRQCDINGNDVNAVGSKNSLNHKNPRKSGSRKDQSDKSFDYYPRGRVSIDKGTAFIYIHPILNTPALIDAIIGEYGIDKLDVKVERNNAIPRSHYDFLMDLLR